MELTPLQIKDYKILPPLTETGGASRFALVSQAGEFYKSCQILSHGKQDKEALVDALLRIGSHLSGFAYSLGGCLEIITLAAPLIRKATAFLFMPFLAPLGLAVSLLEICLDCIKLRRNSLFFHNLPSPTHLPLDELHKIINKHKDYPAVREALSALNRSSQSEKRQALLALFSALEEAGIFASLSYIRNTYLPLSPEETRDLTPLLQAKRQKINDETRLNQLARRVQPWCQERIFLELPSILEKIRSKDPRAKEQGLEEAKDLLATVRTQGQKTLWIHAFSLTFLSISVLGFVGSIVIFPPLLPIILLSLGGAGCLLTDVYSSSTLPCQRWEMDLRHYVPNWIHSICGTGIGQDRIFLEEVLHKNIEHLEKIKDPYLKARAYFSALEQGLLESEEKEKETREKLRSLSLFYFHKAETLSRQSRLCN